MSGAWKTSLGSSRRGCRSARRIALPASEDDAPYLLTEEEEAAVEHLLAFMEIVKDEWGLFANHDQLVLGMHLLQQFVQQHVLHRLDPDNWSDWYTETEEKAGLIFKGGTIEAVVEGA
jgi:hypothetical protein